MHGLSADTLISLLPTQAKCYGWGATRENGSKIGDFAATRSV